MPVKENLLFEALFTGGTLEDLVSTVSRLMFLKQRIAFKAFIASLAFEWLWCGRAGDMTPLHVIFQTFL